MYGTEVKKSFAQASLSLKSGQKHPPRRPCHQSRALRCPGPLYLAHSPLAAIAAQPQPSGSPSATGRCPRLPQGHPPAPRLPRTGSLTGRVSSGQPGGLRAGVSRPAGGRGPGGRLRGPRPPAEGRGGRCPPPAPRPPLAPPHGSPAGRGQRRPSGAEPSPVPAAGR